MNNEQDQAKKSCDNCGGQELSIMKYADMHSAQTVYHCTTCGYIYWNHSLPET